MRLTVAASVGVSGVRHLGVLHGHRLHCARSLFLFSNKDNLLNEKKTYSPSEELPLRDARRARFEFAIHLSRFKDRGGIDDDDRSCARQDADWPTNSARSAIRASRTFWDTWQRPPRPLHAPSSLPLRAAALYSRPIRSGDCDPLQGASRLRSPRSMIDDNNDQEDRRARCTGVQIAWYA